MHLVPFWTKILIIVALYIYPTGLFSKKKKMRLNAAAAPCGFRFRHIVGDVLSPLKKNNYLWNKKKKEYES
jgi:hypothetical protein